MDKRDLREQWEPENWKPEKWEPQQKWEPEMWSRQQVQPAGKQRVSQPEDEADADLGAQPGKALAGAALLIVGIAVGLVYPSKFSAVFALVAVVFGGSLFTGGIRPRKTDEGAHQSQR
jgi:hypothetical protein